MKIKGRTVLQFLPFFLHVQSPNGHISDTSIMTIYNILTSYSQLTQMKKVIKISVKDLITKAGYSRTTFYSYFTDISEVRSTIVDMVSYHTNINADVYFACFLGQVTSAEEKEILMTIHDFSPYIHALMLSSPEYSSRYTQDFNKAFSKVINVKEITEETRPYLLNALSAAMVALLTNSFSDNNLLSLQKAMNCTKILIQSIIDAPENTNKNNIKQLDHTP